MHTAMSSPHVALQSVHSHPNAAFQSDTLDEKSRCRRALSWSESCSVQENAPKDSTCSLPVPAISTICLPVSEVKEPIVHRPVKLGRQRFRWNLVFNVLVWMICPLPLWLPAVSNGAAVFVLPAIQCFFVLIWLTISVLAARNALVIYRYRNRDYSFLLSTAEKTRIRHVVAISCYKEPLELIKRSVDTLAAQSEVNRISMVISFEERTPDVHEKCAALQVHYAQSGFRDLLFTVHPYGLANEIAGKCSNANYALRQATEQLKLDHDNTDDVLITTCDADSQFHRQYIAALTYRYIQDHCPALTTLYQPPLFYNWNLDASSCFTRVTGLLRSTLMLGALIPFSINTMSIFSFSLSLAKAGHFVHPAYQMDDIICLIRWMGVTGRRLSIRMVPTPVISGPTCGRTIEYEFMEWSRQARRWTIGAAEVFHYFMIKSRRIPFLAALSWSLTFLIYYGILLCSSGLYGLTFLFASLFLLEDVPVVILYAMYILVALQMLAFAVAFLIDTFIPRLLNVNECVCVVRNVFHFLMTPLVLIGYSCVEFYALHEVMIRGKKVCKHGASNKSTLT